MMKEKGQFKKKFVQKIATIMMAAAMVVSGGFGVAPAADHSVSVYATDNAYRGYHVTSTKTEKKPATSSTKKSKLSKNHANKTTKTVTTTTTSTGYKHVVAKDTKTVTKTVVTTTKVYYKKTLTTTVKKQVTVTTTTINYLRSGNPDYMKLMGTVNTQIPTKVGNAMKADGLKVVLNPNLSYDGVYSASRNSIEMKNNVDYCFMHEIGHYVDRKTGYVSGSTEFKNIFNSEKSKYKGFYSDWNLDSGNYARTSTSDYFAECFKDYYFSANSRSKLKANCPKSYSFIQKTINKF